MHNNQHNPGPNNAGGFCTGGPVCAQYKGQLDCEHMGAPMGCSWQLSGGSSGHNPGGSGQGSGLVTHTETIDMKRLPKKRTSERSAPSYVAGFK